MLSLARERIGRGRLIQGQLRQQGRPALILDAGSVPSGPGCCTTAAFVGVGPDTLRQNTPAATCAGGDRAGTDRRSAAVGFSTAQNSLQSTACHLYRPSFS